MAPTTFLPGETAPLLPSFSHQWEDFDFPDSFCASVEASGPVRQFTLACAF